MRSRSIRIDSIVAVAAVAGLLATTDLGAAGSDSGSHRTPWGDPDLQGIWTNATLTPLERPAELAGKEVLTAEEAAELERTTVEQRIRSDGTSPPGTVGGYNLVWRDGGTKVVAGRRTSLIVDPADGRIPWRPEAERASKKESARYGVGPYDSWVDLDTGERCISDGLPTMVPLQPYNMNFQIFQAPGVVAMLHEMYHEVRIIPVDGRPHLPETIDQWLGDPRGRWEGDTLVVETTNLADKRHYVWAHPWRKARPSYRLVERFTRIDEATIDYEFTVEDPQMFTQPWTASAPMTNDQAARGVTTGVLFEYACHEGNSAVANILSGARAQERD